MDVYNNGGKVRCYVHYQNDQYRIDLIGNATYVYRADVSFEWDTIENYAVTNKIYFEEEAVQYKNYNKKQSNMSKII